MKERRRKILRTAVPLMLLLVVAAVSFGVWVTNKPEVTKKEPLIEVVQYDEMYPERLWTDKPFAEAYIKLDYDVSRSLKEMADKSDLIIIGKHFIDRSRDIQDIYESFTSQDPPISMSEGLSYVQTGNIVLYVKVTEVLKGEAGKDINIISNDYNVFKYLDFEFDADNPVHYDAFDYEIGEKYVFFLKYDEETGYYKYATAPSVIRIMNDKAVLQSPLIKATDNVMFYKLLDNRYSTDMLIKVTYNLEKIEDNITGMTVAELKDAIK